MNKITARIRSSKRIEYFILSIIILCALFARLYKIATPVADWHSWRQVDTASVSRIYVDEGIDLLRPRYYDISSIQTGDYNPQGYRFVEFPLYNAIHALAFVSFPQIAFDIWGRVISIFSSLITVILIYLIGKKVSGKGEALFSAFFLSLLPFNIFFSRVVLPEPMATMFAILALYLFLIYYGNDSKVALFISSIAFCTSILIKPFAGFYALPIAYLAIKKHGIVKIFQNIPLVIAIDLALLPFFAWRVWMDQFAIGIPHYKWAFNGDEIRFRPAFFRWIFGERLGHLILGTWGLIPFSLGFLRRNKKSLVPELMLLGMLLYVVVVATASVRHDYYQSITIPAIALMLGIGSIQLLNFEGSKFFIKAAFLGFIITMMFGMSFYQIKEFYKVNHPEFVEAGNKVDELTPKDSLVIAPNNGDTGFLYYTKRRGWPVLEQDIKDVVKKGADYFVSVNKNDADTTKFKQMYETLYEAERFMIIDLNKPL